MYRMALLFAVIAPLFAPYKTILSPPGPAGFLEIVPVYPRFDGGRGYRTHPPRRSRPLCVQMLSAHAALRSKFVKFPFVWRIKHDSAVQRDCQAPPLPT